MRVLLDTHTGLWFVLGDNSLMRPPAPRSSVKVQVGNPG
jgi:hypothetical protein